MAQVLWTFTYTILHVGQTLSRKGKLEGVLRKVDKLMNIPQTSALPGHTLLSRHFCHSQKGRFGFVDLDDVDGWEQVQILTGGHLSMLVVNTESNPFQIKTKHKSWSRSTSWASSGWGKEPFKDPLSFSCLCALARNDKGYLKYLEMGIDFDLNYAACQSLNESAHGSPRLQTINLHLLVWYQSSELGS